jgi:mono/diheme cytochrome c family protein
VVWVGAAAGALVLAIAIASVGAAQEAALDGKEIFLAQKCNLCHSVEAAGIERTMKSEKLAGPELTGLITAETDRAWLAQFLRKQVDKETKKHGKEFKGSDEELTAVLDWLALQKKPG